MCPCDIVDAPNLDETVDPAALQQAAHKAVELIPEAARLGIAHAWSGIRTLTPDDRPVIGPDPRLPGLFWVAGLGGHGIAGAPATARVAADLLIEGHTDLVEVETMSPSRWIQ